MSTDDWIDSLERNKMMDELDEVAKKYRPDVMTESIYRARKTMEDARKSGNATVYLDMMRIIPTLVQDVNYMDIPGHWTETDCKFFEKKVREYKMDFELFYYLGESKKYKLTWSFE